ncbi:MULTISPECIES: MFS transporter [unclassified Nonomuraea]|uniref:MFS transporter n=1 Tax=unclassified Nonomuraea TaxID=2593643 RepID=UPI00207BB851|nr:MFS transporter [Nonomuraea sp. KC401]
MALPPSPSRSSGLVTAALAFSGMVVSMMFTLMVPIIPDLPRLLSAPAEDASWAITSTLLSSAVFTPVSGRLGDMYGKRRMMVISLALMVIGSAICVFTSSLPLVVLGRTLQGCAVGVIPLGISIMRDLLPSGRLGSAMALMSATLGAGGAIGLPVGAVVAQYADWHMLFLVAAAMGATGLVLTLTIVPDSSLRAGGRFDFPGVVGLSAGLVCFLLPISKGGSWGWTSPLTLGLFAAAAVIFAVWTFVELRVANPLVDLRTTTRRQVLLTNLASIAFGFAMFGTQLVFPQVLQAPPATGYGLGLSLFEAGLCMAVGGGMMILLSPVSARITGAYGPKVTLILGALLAVAGYAGALAVMTEVWHVALAATIVSAGAGLGYAAMPASIMSAVPVSETAAANGFNSLMRSIGTATASAVISTVLAAHTVRLGAASLPTQDGLRYALIISAAAGVAGMAISVFLPRRRPSRPEAGPGRVVSRTSGVQAPS